MTNARSRRRRNLLAVTSLGLAGLLVGLLAGCSASGAPAAVAAPIVTAPATPAVSYADLAGNWQISSTAPTSAGLSSLAGSFAVSGETVSGMLHPLTGSCLTPSLSTPFAVTGAIAAGGELTLTSSSFQGGTLHLTGTIAADQHSLLNAQYSISGGSCAPAAQPSFASLRPQDNSPITIAQQYQPIQGTYTGNFSDPDGVVMNVSAVLTQSSSPDANGYYHLSGNATFANNPCLNAPVVTDSVINGATISTTYTDPNTGNSITATGTFDSTATTLNVTSWTLAGSCGPDQGTGTLTK